ncbi:hypothetical protein J4573_19440 [Actinomadura barringtoniae]|uniref:Uncharacterized protein n=1 Tax=Actinomadura barringtoniae TaxID=1427535 RepID=A0A939T299_9ACTN|nr:hypothetical protein [Actinomadura barringtoniae]MBO2449286.1 hypothetical protein [Actinomadura barringtoniae]
MKTRYIVSWTVISICGTLLIAQAVAKSLGGGDPSSSAGARRDAGTSSLRAPADDRRPMSITPTSPITPSASSTVPPPVDPPPAVTIAVPGQRADVVGKTGVRLSGTAGQLRGNSLQVFIFAQDGRYYAASGGPIPVVNGRWALSIPRLGAGARDVGSIFVIMAALADHSCVKTLKAAHADKKGNVMFKRLPRGCREGASVTVHKIAP